jgi:hypothetical protein
MEAHADVQRSIGRFSKILALETKKPIYDEVLANGEDWVVTPTLGSIVPNWLLVIPTSENLNFKEWSVNSGRNPKDLILNVTNKLNLGSANVIWFEHGPNRINSKVGCGIDHAHIHLLINPPFTYQELFDAVLTECALVWKSVDSSNIYRQIPDNKSYLVCATEQKANYAIDAESVGSQFFRRVIANLVGMPECWNYREFPHINNVLETVKLIEQHK